MNAHLSRLTDEELVAKSQEGDAASFGELFRRYFGYVYTALKNQFFTAFGREDLRDITQEAFLKAWKMICRYKPMGRGSFKVWIVGLSVNFCIDKLRTKRHKEREFRRFVRYSSIFDLLRICRIDPDDPLDVINDRLEIVQSALDRLTEYQRKAYLLFVAGGMKQRDVADEMGTTLGAVEQAVSSARKKLHQFIFKTG